MSDNILREINIGKPGLMNLVELDLEQNLLTKLPAELFVSPYLIDVNLGDNQLSEIPIFVNVRLKELKIPKNQIRELMSNFESLYTTECIRYIGESIQKLPEEMVILGNLTVLEIGDCQIENLPEAVGNMPKLTQLEVSNNPLNSDALDLLLLWKHLKINN